MCSEVSEKYETLGFITSAGCFIGDAYCFIGDAACFIGNAGCFSGDAGCFIDVVGRVLHKHSVAVYCIDIQWPFTAEPISELECFQLPRNKDLTMICITITR